MERVRQLAFLDGQPIDSWTNTISYLACSPSEHFVQTESAEKLRDTFLIRTI